MGKRLPADLAAAAELGGEMGRRFATFDWASHPLGPPRTWSARWRAAVSAALTSRFPIVLWLGPDMFLVYNDAYLPVLGDKHPASLGAPGHEVWAELWDVIGPMLDGVLATGVATWSDDLMLPVRTADRPQERYFTFTYSPLVAKGGGVDGIFCAVAETTGRVIGARRLEVLNDLAAALIDAASVDAAVVRTVEVSEANPADLPGLAIYLGGADGPLTLRGATAGAGALLAVGPPASPSPGSGARVVALSDDAPGGAAQAVVQPVAPTATLRGAVVIGINARRPLDDQYLGFCARVADQFSAAAATAAAYEAERERAEALARLDAAKTVFLANVSHEFRTPLTLLLGPLEDAIATSKGDPALAEQLQTAHRNARRLLRMVNALLDFTRFEAGQPGAQLVTADLGRLTADIASSFADVCRRAGVGLVLRCERATGEVDPEWWETIVLNLVSNAFKFTLEGSITVAVAPAPGGGAALTVTDTGVGIAPEDLDRVFDRFYRPHGHRGRSVEGSGIGLALVQSLVKLLHGSVAVESTPGAGTTVSVRLPPPRPGATGGTAETTRRAAGSENDFVVEALGWLDEPGRGAPGVPTGRPAVLVADDNADMRRHLERILGEHYDVAAVGDGEAALRRIRESPPDLVVADVMMPALDGFGLVAAIRADPELSAIPVVILSARAGDEAEAEGLAAGSDDYLAKPFRSTDLLHRVASRLATAGRMARRDGGEGLALGAAALAGAVSSARSADDLLAALFSAQRGSIGAPAAALGVVDADDDLIRMHYAGAVERVVADRYHVVSRSAPVPIAAAIREDRAVAVEDRRHDATGRFDATDAELVRSVRASLVVPVLGRAGALGALGFMWPSPRAIAADDVRRAWELARLAGPALVRLQATAHEHRLATELQDRLLALDVGASPAVVCARYQSASASLRVGGDWFTATTVGADRLDVSVGDVVGHGMPAVAAMSRLRSALTSAAVALPDPGDALDLVERYAQTVPDATCATLAYAVLDHRRGSLRYTCAGHPYPLVVDEKGAVALLRDARRPPLGTAPPGTAARWAEVPLPPGSLLVLYTDGLIERRGESLDAGFARVCDVAASLVRLPAGEVCDTLLAKLAPDGGYEDDVALVSVRPCGETATSFVDAFPAALGEVGAARRRLRAWLEAGVFSKQKTFDVLLAVGEAMNNAVEHGSAFDAERHVTLEAFVGEEGTLSVTVGDQGRWRRDSADSRRTAASGRGLTLMHGLSGEVTFVRGEAGTRVTLTFPPSARRGAG